VFGGTLSLNQSINHRGNSVVRIEKAANDVKGAAQGASKELFLGRGRGGGDTV